MNWFKRYTRRMDAPQDNPRKVNLKLAELNKGLATPQWVPADGLSALTGFKFGYNEHNSQFLSGSGIPVKVFFNNVTGEVKIFLAILFRD